MKYVVKVAGKTFEVEIENIYARPVIARVDGQEFEISPENGSVSASPVKKKDFVPAEPPRAVSNPGANTGELTAPLPGTVIEVFMKAGDTIETGQVVLIIEAMKMKNSIRSTRAGKIAEILVSPGQTVAHKQALVRFE